MVINATRDAFQFSVAEAEKSIARARPVFRLYDAGDQLAHVTFESGHAYSQPMREAMYGWMTRWLKNEGDGKPVPEPKHDVEKPEDLRCYPDGVRPKGFLFPPAFAAREARRLLEAFEKHRPDHVPEWESTVAQARDLLRSNVLGDFPRPPRPVARSVRSDRQGDVAMSAFVLQGEAGMPLPMVVRARAAGAGKQPACVVLHLDGKQEALAHPLTDALVGKGWQVVAPDLRATGETRPARDEVRGAPDHNSAEHALWIGRPLLGQWVFDVLCVLDWLALQPGLDQRRLTVAGLGQAVVLALCASVVF
jgi:hypothetical protein